MQHLLRFSACLFKAPHPKKVSSDWSAPTSLSRHHPYCFSLRSACGFRNHSHAGGSAEVGDGSVFTSQPYRILDGSFEGTVSEYVLWNECFSYHYSINIAPRPGL